MKPLFSFVLTLLLAPALVAQPGPDFFTPQLNINHPQMQVVFALDCTGSMSGLIETAKDKIWTIASSLAQTEQQMDISIGLVAYRDRGDAFVTQITDLNTDLDYVYNQLMQLRAGGGGDGPESVNQALNDAIHQISWNTEPGVTRSVFIVGDCEPHMDYEEKQYPELCAEARQQDIAVNTILMGTNAAARTHWTAMADAAGGDFFAVGMNANNVAVTTPHDTRIKELNQSLDKTMIYYGTESVQIAAEEDEERRKDLYEGLDDASLARRAAFNSTASGAANQFRSGELLNGVATGTLDVEKLSTDQLPSALKDFDGEELKVEIDRRIEERERIQTELQEEIDARDAYIKSALSEAEAKNGFAAKVWSSLRKQAQKNAVSLPESVKY